MTITNTQSGTRVDEIADRIYRISTPVPPAVIPGGFSFNQILLVDDEPLLFHTGPKKLFPLVREAVSAVMPVERLRWLAFSHFEADECGALDDWLAAAPNATAACSHVAANVSVNDVAMRPARGLADGEVLSLGAKSVRWIDTPHMPHAWECGLMFETATRTLLSGDLFTQGGADTKPLVETDILGPSESFRSAMDYYSHTKNAAALIEKIASTEPATLACMHGSSYRGDGAALLRELGRALG